MNKTAENKNQAGLTSEPTSKEELNYQQLLNRQLGQGMQMLSLAQAENSVEAAIASRNTLEILADSLIPWVGKKEQWFTDARESISRMKSAKQIFAEKYAHLKEIQTYDFKKRDTMAMLYKQECLRKAKALYPHIVRLMNEKDLLNKEQVEAIA